MIKVCKDCKERHEACHDTCEKYKAEREELNRINAERRKHTFVEVAIVQTKTRIYQKMQKGHRR